MVKAGALLYAIFISFILAILTSIFMLVSYYSDSFKQQLIQSSVLNDNIESALNIYLTNSNSFHLNKPNSINLFEEEDSNVQINISQWGLYNIVHLSAKWKHLFLDKIVLTGQKIEKGKSVALYY